MRRAIATPVLLLAALAASVACESGGSNESTASEATAASPASTFSTPRTTPAPSNELSPEMREQLFVTFLEGKGFVPMYMSAEVAVQLAGALCGRYATGATYEDVVSVLLDGGISPFEAGGFEGAAVTAFCPEYADKRQGTSFGG